MYEPKYKLNQRDRKRFNALAVKEALSTISASERVELEKLERKRRIKANRHPRMQAYHRRRYYCNAKMKRLCVKLDGLIAKSPELKRAFGDARFSSVFEKK